MLLRGTFLAGLVFPLMAWSSSSWVIYRMGAAPATADWGVRGTFLGAAALSLLFVPACGAMVRRATGRAAAGAIR